MDRYLLDSNAFLWAKGRPETLSRQAQNAIGGPENPLFVSAAALWELADKASKGKLPEFAAMLRSASGGLRRALQESGIQLLPVEIAHIEEAYRLPLHHRDPFDRIMIGQAVVENLTIISRDRIFRHYRGVKLLPA